MASLKISALVVTLPSQAAKRTPWLEKGSKYRGQAGRGGIQRVCRRLRST